ncbi:hypothetical protein [Pseudodesulfovibrio sp. zrk46]|uniref:hypothetical protein n=1 Tax=Pseudodesulfovibrio sp. zrk46 TaxID=2725288 RepID=UPI0014498D50|nr:hypothetical protein [Pseudodesulfovibrio sp. zrk46]QJB55371.1 hypothetical protein HFN16_02725 [Pseudodesulfovibrio sp. zrk46]
MPFIRFFCYYLIYWIIFTAAAVSIRINPPQGMPDTAIPALATFILIPVFMIMSYILIVARPHPRFELSRKQRWMRFLVYQCSYILFVWLAAVILGVEIRTQYSWITGLLPAVLLQHMIRGVRVITPVLNPKTDGKWRGFKYALLYQFIAVAAVFTITILFFQENTDNAVYAGIPVIILIMLSILYRLTVASPHSRFNSLSKREKLIRFIYHVGAYITFCFMMPIGLTMLWHWELPQHCDSAIVLLIFLSAIHGSDGSPHKGIPYFTGNNHAPIMSEGAIKRRLAEVKQQDA